MGQSEVREEFGSQGWLLGKSAGLFASGRENGWGLQSPTWDFGGQTAALTLHGLELQRMQRTHPRELSGLSGFLRFLRKRDWSSERRFHSRSCFKLLGFRPLGAFGLWGLLAFGGFWLLGAFGFLPLAFGRSESCSQIRSPGAVCSEFNSLSSTSEKSSGKNALGKVGWPTGLEPATTRITIWGSTIDLRPPTGRDVMQWIPPSSSRTHRSFAIKIGFPRKPISVGAAPLSQHPCCLNRGSPLLADGPRGRGPVRCGGYRCDGSPWD